MKKNKVNEVKKVDNILIKIIQWLHIFSIFSYKYSFVYALFIGVYNFILGFGVFLILLAGFLYNIGENKK